METEPITVQGVKDAMKCSICNGNGYTAEHNPDSFDYERGEHNCHGCPIQVPCEHCSGTGIRAKVSLYEILDQFHDAELPSEEEINKGRENHCEKYGKLVSESIAFREGANYVINYIKSKTKQG